MVRMNDTKVWLYFGPKQASKIELNDVIHDAMSALGSACKSLKLWHQSNDNNSYFAKHIILINISQRQKKFLTPILYKYLLDSKPPLNYERDKFKSLCGYETDKAKVINVRLSTEQ